MASPFPTDEDLGIEFIPIKQFSERYAEGWRMVPGYPLEAHDYAVKMVPPSFPESNRVCANKGRRWRAMDRSGE